MDMAMLWYALVLSGVMGKHFSTLVQVELATVIMSGAIFQNKMEMIFRKV